MRSPSPLDLSGLAELAQRPDDGLRPLLLRVQATGFAAAAQRDPDMIRSFEALALGLIPLVTSDVLAEVAQILRRAPETPASVLTLLRDRLEGPREAPTAGAAESWARRPALTPGAVDDLLALDRPSIDLALAENGRIVIDGHALALLVDRALDRRELARALLVRVEPTVQDRASLYRHADAAARARIRADLATMLPRFLPARDPARREEILRAAQGGDWRQLVARLAVRLGAEPRFVCDLAEPAEQELVALALVAAGLPEEECVRVFLTLDPAVARSVTAVFRLTDLVRETPPAVAACLVGAGRAAETARPPGVRPATTERTRRPEAFAARVALPARPRPRDARQIEA